MSKSSGCFVREDGKRLMRIELQPKLAELRQQVRRFADDVLTGWAEALDSADEFPDELVEVFAQQGYLGMRLPAEWGGAGMSLAHYCLVQEEVSRQHPMFSVLLARSNGLTPSAIERHGTPEQKRKYLPPIVKGLLQTSFALTEPEAGSDAGAITTRAERRADGWAITGMKHYISHVEAADVVLVMAVTDPAAKGRGRVTGFLVDKGTPGMRVSRTDRTMGSAAWILSELTFDGCIVPDEAVLGTVGRGFSMALETLNEGRLSVASSCLGTADRLLALSVEHAKTRRTFGAPLSERQAIQWMLADSATELAAARGLLYPTVEAVSDGQPIGAEASMCKLLCTETAFRIADRAVQVHGAMGLIRGFPIERAFRDLRLFRVGEGSSEVQRMVIARELLQQP